MGQIIQEDFQKKKFVFTKYIRLKVKSSEQIQQRLQFLS